MLFNSYLFIFLFLPLSFLIFIFIQKIKINLFSVYYLLILSIIFYAYSNIEYLPLLIISIVINFIFSNLIKNNSKNISLSKIILIFSIVFNLVLLAYFKYSSFILNDILGIFIFDDSYIFDGQIPLGISIYSFTQIGFLVDCYKKKTEKTDLGSYALFVSLFPHVLAGPIIHHKDIISQIRSNSLNLLSSLNIRNGILLFVIGLSKKLLIADNLAPIADSLFSNPENVDIISTWIGTLAYTFQLYFDFSGYSDMALGIALMFNIILPINFNSPYKSKSLIDFWKSWHMTLSAFLKEYLYIPLGGNRKGEINRYINIFLTMILGGIWHGANFTFFFWGLFHGIGIIINHLFLNLKLNIPKILSIFITFLFVHLCWVVFRAENMNDAFIIYKNLINFVSLNLSTFTVSNLLILFAALIAFFTPNSQEIVKSFKTKFELRNIVSIPFFSIIFFISIISINSYSPFLYFAF